MDAQSNLSTAIRRATPRLISVVALQLLFALIFGIAVAQAHDLRQQGSVEQQAIQVWKVGSPHTGDLPDGRVAADVMARAAKLDCRLVVRTLFARDFSASFTAALKTNDEPDILVIDNMGLILGITTPLGRFEGIGRDPKVRDSLINVTEALRQLASNSGWQLLLTTSRNFAKAKSLAMSGERCNATYADKGAPWSGEALTDISSIAMAATLAYFNKEKDSLDNLVGGRYEDDSLPFQGDRHSVSGMEICGGWGNDRLAFVYTVASVESSKVGAFRGAVGFRSLLVVTAKVNDSWRLLSLSDSPGIVKVLQGRVRLLAAHETETKLQVPTLVAPADQAYFKRWPIEQRPEVEWTKAGQGRISYLVDSQFEWGKRWSGSGFVLVAGAGEDALTMKHKATFGAGMQPHRWRIWAIGENGEVVRSEWRVVNYLD